MVNIFFLQHSYVFFEHISFLLTQQENVTDVNLRLLGDMNLMAGMHSITKSWSSRRDSFKKSFLFRLSGNVLMFCAD